MAQSNVQFKSAFTPPLFRYIRADFQGAGVDNYTSPPSQNPDMFMRLDNVMPTTKGVIERRWGYQVWNNTNPLVAQRMYEYQNNNTDVRLILATAADGTGIGSSTNNIFAYAEDGTYKTSVLTPRASATVPYLVVSRNYAYISDGVVLDLKKWDGTNLTNWGIAAPTTAVGLTAQTGTAYSWQANTEFWSLGIFFDANNNAEQLISVNALGDNAGGVFGKSGPGQPTWNQAKNGTTVDGTVTWTNVGQITLWQPGMTVTYRQPIYDPETGGLFISWLNNGTQTTGLVKPNFNGTDGVITTEKLDNFELPSLQWGCIGNISTGLGGVNADNLPWKSITGYNTLNHYFSGVVEPQALPATIGAPLPKTPLYLQVNLGAPGTTGTGSGNPPAILTSTSGQTSTDGQLTWLNLGSAVRSTYNSLPVNQFSTLGNTFTCIKDAGNNIQVCTTSGTVAASPPVFASTFGATTPDGGAVWTCLGPAPSWAATTFFFLPNSGWAVPTQVEPNGGSEIVATVSNIKYEQFVTASGKSGNGIPAFNTVAGGTTPDGTVTWTNGGLFVATTGNITFVNGVVYFTVFRNSVTGNISDLSPVSASTGPLTNDAIVLSNIPISTDPQVTDVLILRTADGGNQETLYFDASVPNGTTTFTDTTSTVNLLDNNIYQETDSFGNLIGVANNQPPLPGSFAISNQGRLFMISGMTLLFSKSLGDLTTSTGTICGRWEEDWPPGYQLDISSIVETPRGIQTDGYALYIGTERKIHKLLGNGPTNFSQPQVVFNEVGLLNQPVWQTVYAQGQPVGMMWLTPDNRVIGSDYNVYDDIGHPIQTTLNTINTNVAQSTAWAMFVSNGQFDLYVLAIPTGISTVNNTVCVFDLRARQWFIWQLADNISTGVFNINASGIPQWIFSANTGVVYKTAPNIYNDRYGGVPTPYTVTAQTSWLSIYEDSFRKLLNEMEVMTGDANLLVTVEGANTLADFTAPITLLSNAPLTLGIFGEYKAMLAASPSKSRWYRLTFTSSSTIQNILSGYNIEAIPLNQV